MWAAEPIDDDEAWVDQVSFLMLEHDPDLDAHEIRDIVTSLSKYPHWRQLSPAEAAAKTLEPPESAESP